MQGQISQYDWGSYFLGLLFANEASPYRDGDGLKKYLPRLNFLDMALLTAQEAGLLPQWEDVPQSESELHSFWNGTCLECREWYLARRGLLHVGSLSFGGLGKIDPNTILISNSLIEINFRKLPILCSPGEATRIGKGLWNAARYFEDRWLSHRSAP